MSTQSKIEWTETTWNPVTGCTRISAGCKNCYAERMAKRLKAMGQENYRNGFEVTLHEHMVELPLQWRRPRRIFVNSMSDLFHEEVPSQFILRIFDTIMRCPQHNFQILTKRSKRLRSMAHLLSWPPNVWIGVSVENEKAMHRIKDLESIPAMIKFLSCEPLIGPLENLPLKNIHWVIVGGESGPGARPMNPSWLDAIYFQCLSAGIPFFFKQWGGVRKDRTGRLLHGRTYDEMPYLSKIQPGIH